MRKRLLPFPLFSVALFGMWILLTGFSPGHVLLGALIAVIVSRVMLTLAPEPPRIRFGMAMTKLIGIVLKDIMRSNIAVARIILSPARKIRSGFIEIPIELHSPYAMGALAIIITATPGTLWLQHDAGRRSILIHVLDLVDEEEWIDLIKNRYEKLLMEIFQ
ncbi:MAG: Na+/H+ antiporter subunit E [Novosphingobium sp.]|nr:Na+/H+ antiporter subunit E [Novosphingobium sp.]